MTKHTRLSKRILVNVKIRNACRCLQHHAPKLFRLSIKLLTRKHVKPDTWALNMHPKQHSLLRCCGNQNFRFYKLELLVLFVLDFGILDSANKTRSHKESLKTQANCFIINLKRIKSWPIIFIALSTKNERCIIDHRPLVQMSVLWHPNFAK